MATLGALMSQQLSFTLTTSGGTLYTHGLGFTPTVILLTAFGTAQTGTCPTSFFYTLANSVTVTVGTSLSQANNLVQVDILCGSLHSLVR